MNIDQIIKSIQNLSWQDSNPHFLVWAFYRMGKEYAESVRITMRTYPENPLVKNLGLEELDTNNLSYLNYNKSGDHWEFLKYFLENSLPLNIPSELNNALDEGEEVVKKMTDKQRSMTVFLREKKGSGIFKTIIESRNWEEIGLGYFKYYLERHIELDSKEGGHGDLADVFEIDSDIALKFYQTRFNIYKNCIDARDASN